MAASASHLKWTLLVCSHGYVCCVEDSELKGEVLLCLPCYKLVIA
jgi:hypothetical protein